MEKTEKETEAPKIEKEPSKGSKPKSKKRFILPIILILVIIGSLGYIGYDKHQEKVEESQEEYLNIGIQYGAESLLLEIFNEATTCTPLPINNGSLEINLIAVECLGSPEQ